MKKVDIAPTRRSQNEKKKTPFRPIFHRTVEYTHNHVGPWKQLHKGPPFENVASWKSLNPW
jgi:hypothetical protein